MLCPYHPVATFSTGDIYGRADDQPPLPLHQWRRAALPPLVQRLLKALDATAPTGATDSQSDRDENRQATRELFELLDPRDPAEAQLAAIGIAAAQSAMDNFVRAAQPGVARRDGRSACAAAR